MVPGGIQTVFAANRLRSSGPTRKEIRRGNHGGRAAIRLDEATACLIPKLQRGGKQRVVYGLLKVMGRDRSEMDVGSVGFVVG